MAARQRSLQRLARATLIWMAIEAAGSLWAAGQAHSVVLLAFGGDSLVELLSAAVVLVSSRKASAKPPRWAAIAAAILLLALAAVILATAGLSLAGRVKPRPTWLGMAVLAGSAAAMPWLAARKRRLARDVSNHILRADAAQSAVCAYLAWIGLAGLGLNSLFRLRWADPAAAVAILPFVIYEARKAWAGRSCGCC